ncbi:MAG: GspH/FimT family protein [Legionella sp.]
MKHKSGFTLLELLVVLVISLLVLFFSLATMRQFTEKNQVTSLIDQLKSAIYYARIQAVIIDKPLILRPLLSNNWSKGAMLFIDNASHLCRENCQILQLWQWNVSEDISWHGFQSQNYLLFTPDVSSQAVNGYFEIIQKNQHYKLILNRFGRIRND